MQFNVSGKADARTALNHLKSIRYWHRPIGGLVEVMQKMGEKSVVTPLDLDKSHVELYICSLFGLGLEKEEGKNFWIAKPKDDPPDFALMHLFFKDKEKILFRSREIEITRHRGDEGNIIKTLLAKDRSYPDDYILVCFIEITGKAHLTEISSTLLREMKNLQHVFLVFHGILAQLPNKVLTPEEISRYVSVVQLTPSYFFQTIDLKEIMMKANDTKEKLIYTDSGAVMYGLRPGEANYPKIL